ncbi:fibromodulin a isoform X2 [Hippocampus zosterae]|nr:fibromodulin a isoform X2 [Hippocampus zosterae]XP_051932849.1 fibromodulin a isoform X2 [Hippocampus zosterae]XP_051932850.1 fibromodulin a isoform X2 [Hippocampus zosterae]XP_051932851.1 fibromodulin a isoform X2 [Hippocampus zosterae]XP_051932852.1 fibromodulin a isoform X2 [Hippocampus zosterae]
MRAVIILLSALLPLCPSHEQDPFAWLYSRRSAIQTDKAGGECPPECDCPPTFSIAMYCDARGLTVMPDVPSRMKYLYLQNNAISAISDSALVNATNLVWLMMHHNRLTSDGISEKAFSRLERLERFYLQHNNLTSIPRNLPRTLRDLRINHNHIDKVTPSDLEGMDNLTILHLHDNAITDMGASLKSLTSLTLLDVSGNKLSKVPEALPERLHQLYLDSNSIASLPEGFLAALTQLQYLRMAHNQLTDKGLPSNIFNATGLVELDLSFNHLERIPLVSSALQHLYLQANRIKEFTLGSFCRIVDVTNFSKLQTLRLDGNELSQQDIPSNSSLCLRLASSVDV